MTFEENWKKFYLVAKKYYEENNNLDIPQKCVIDGLKIGYWINNQRAAYNRVNGKRKISKEHIDKLNEIGMIWYKREDWYKIYNQVKKFYEVYKNLEIPDIYEIDNTKFDGTKLRDWLKLQRSYYQNKYLSEDKIEKLNQLNMAWNLQEASWEHFYSLAKQYYLENGNLDISQKYEVEGEKLGKWINRQKQAYIGNGTYKITETQIKKLNDIEMIWDIKKYRFLNKNISVGTNKYYVKKKLLIMLKETLEQMEDKSFNSKEDVIDIEKQLIKKLS